MPLVDGWRWTMSLLVRPSVALHAAWLEAHEEWGDGRHEDGFGLRETDDVRSSDGFRVFVDRLLARESSPGDDGGTFRWIVEDGEVLGGIALRHESAICREPSQGMQLSSVGNYGSGCLLLVRVRCHRIAPPKTRTTAEQNSAS